MWGSRFPFIHKNVITYINISFGKHEEHINILYESIFLYNKTFFFPDGNKIFFFFKLSVQK